MIIYTKSLFIHKYKWRMFLIWTTRIYPNSTAASFTSLNRVPLLPFLERPLGLGHAVEAHESHHNLNTNSYGLLGVYDWIMGTTRLATV